MSKSNQLSNNETTDVELSDYCFRNVPQFMGVISRDKFAKIYPKMHPGDSLIINIDPQYSKNGTHWVAFRKSSEAPIGYYKDSYGAPPPQDVINAVKDVGVIYGNKINQTMKETNCGKRSALFLQQMSKASSEGLEIEFFESLEK